MDGNAPAERTTEATRLRNDIMRLGRLLEKKGKGVGADPDPDPDPDFVVEATTELGLELERAEECCNDLALAKQFAAQCKQDVEAAQQAIEDALNKKRHRDGNVKDATQRVKAMRKQLKEREEVWKKANKRAKAEKGVRRQVKRAREAGCQLHLNDDDDDGREKDTEKDTCVFCYTKARAYVANPCGHYVFCGDCMEKLQNKNQCPMCRKEVVSFIRVFK